MKSIWKTDCKLFLNMPSVDNNFEFVTVRIFSDDHVFLPLVQSDDRLDQ